MREIARVQQGYFPTPDRIVRAVAGLFRFATRETGAVTVLDAGCGTGKAIHDLRELWLTKNHRQRVTLLGIESDKHRHSQADALLASSPGGGSALWSPIEDAHPDGPVSLLWFNPPYDRIRGAGRLETALFQKVKEWLARGNGLLLMIVPDEVLADPDSGLAVAVERNFALLGRWRFPEPEYRAFKQCVLLARRREKALNATVLSMPAWATSPANWPILPDTANPIAELPYLPGKVTLRRIRLGAAVIAERVAASPLRGSLLREATAPAPPVGRPLLPLKPGHLALALAGGLCDGVIEEKGQRFLVKGTLHRATAKTYSRSQLDENGQPVAVIDTYRTRYAMNVRCLLDNGAIEDFSSADSADEIDPPDNDTSEENEPS